jgi:hypothetical protein
MLNGGIVAARRFEDEKFEDEKSADKSPTRTRLRQVVICDPLMLPVATPVKTRWQNRSVGHGSGYREVPRNVNKIFSKKFRFFYQPIEMKDDLWEQERIPGHHRQWPRSDLAWSASQQKRPPHAGMA